MIFTKFLQKLTKANKCLTFGSFCCIMEINWSMYNEKR